MTKAGFTLLEMLISVAIFSGLVILILSVFVRTASSQARVNVLREKSEVARSAMNRVTNDFQYLYLDHTVTIRDGDTAEQNKRFKGFFSPSLGHQVSLLLRYPNKTGDNQLVYKRYRAENTGGGSKSQSFSVREYRDCTLLDSGTDKEMYLERCATDSGDYHSVLPEGFLLDDRVSEQVFTVLEPDFNPVRTGYLKVALNIKPAEFINSFCASTTKGTCYKVETILTAGGIR